MTDKFARRTMTSVLAIIAFSSIALAHVTVAPSESTAGAMVTYTVRVPTETSSPTVRIVIEFPAALNVSAFEADTGWSADFERNSAGRITQARIEGGSIAPREASEFRFVCLTPAEAGELVWQIQQVYEDGNSSEWTPATTVTSGE